MSNYGVTDEEHTAEAQYREQVERVRDQYQERIVAVLERLREEFIRLGYDCSPVVDDSIDDYRWVFEAEGARDGVVSDETRIGVTFKIVESLEYEGTTEGVTFKLDIDRYDGRMLGGFEPYNFTPGVWVPFEGENEFSGQTLEDRFSMFEEAGVDGISELLEED